MSDALTIVLPEESGSSLLICALDTTASTTDESRKPRQRAQRISHAMMPVICAACSRWWTIPKYRVWSQSIDAGGLLMPQMKSHTEYMTLNTKQRYEMVHLTPEVEAIVRRSGIVDGLCFVSPMHITAAIYVNDNEEGLIEDIGTWLEKLAPAWPSYKHHGTGEDNADAHLKALLLHHETTLPVTKG